MNSSAARSAIILIAVIASGAALLWLRDILTPLALALFLMVMIDAFARVVQSRIPRIGRWATPLAITLFVVGFGLMVVVVAENASAFIGDLIAQRPKIDNLIARVAGILGIQAPPAIDQLFRQLNPTQYIGSVAQAFQNLASQSLLVFIYLGFLLASRHGFAQKTHRLFRDPAEFRHAASVFVRIRDGIERYLWIQTVTGLMIAVASWALMAAIGMQSAFFWAFLIFVASYIPIIGGFVGIALPPVFALVQFDTYWQALVLLVALQTTQFIVGNVVQPRMQGQSLNLDPVVVLLSLALWGALWGVPGMFLSTPLTVMAMVILVQFPSSRWMAVLLSGNGKPEGLSEGPSDPSELGDKRRTPPHKQPPEPAAGEGRGRAAPARRVSPKERGEEK